MGIIKKYTENNCEIAIWYMNESLDELKKIGNSIDYQKFKSAYADYAESSELENSFFVWKMLNIEAFMRAFSISPTSLRLNNKGQYS